MVTLGKRIQNTLNDRNLMSRFFIHLSIQSFATAIISKYGRAGDEAMLFPSRRTAERCKEFVVRKRDRKADESPYGVEPKILELVLDEQTGEPGRPALTAICAVIMPASDWELARKFWQHTGEGISSRRADIFRKAFDEGHLLPQAGTSTSNSVISPGKGPRRYQRRDSNASIGKQPVPKGQAPDVFGTVQFVEERFGRNLDMSLSQSAKLAIRKRIAGGTQTDTGLYEAVAVPDTAERLLRQDAFASVDDVYLYPCGMDAIFHAHQTLLRAKGSLRSIMFG